MHNLAAPHASVAVDKSGNPDAPFAAHGVAVTAAHLQPDYHTSWRQTVGPAESCALCGQTLIVATTHVTKARW